MSLTLCRIGSGFDSNFWGKSNLEFGQIWSTVGLEFSGGLALPTRLEVRLFFTVSLSMSMNTTRLKIGRVTCLGSTCSHRRSLPFQSSQTCSTLTDRNGRETRRRQERCSEAKKTPPWRSGTMMQEMDCIDGDDAVQSTDESDFLAGIIALIDGSTYPVFSTDRQTDIRFAKHVASNK